MAFTVEAKAAMMGVGTNMRWNMGGICWQLVSQSRYMGRTPKRRKSNIAVTKLGKIVATDTQPNVESTIIIMLMYVFCARSLILAIKSFSWDLLG